MVVRRSGMGPGGTRGLILSLDLCAQRLDAGHHGGGHILQDGNHVVGNGVVRCKKGRHFVKDAGLVLGKLRLGGRNRCRCLFLFQVGTHGFLFLRKFALVVWIVAIVGVVAGAAAAAAAGSASPDDAPMAVLYACPWADSL